MPFKYTINLNFIVINCERGVIMEKKQRLESKKCVDKNNKKFLYKKEKYCSAPHCQDAAQDG